MLELIKNARIDTALIQNSQAEVSGVTSKFGSPTLPLPLIYHIVISTDVFLILSNREKKTKYLLPRVRIRCTRTVSKF